MTCPLPVSWPHDQRWVPYAVGGPLIPTLIAAFVTDVKWTFPMNIYVYVNRILWGSQLGFQIFIGIAFSLHIIESIYAMWLGLKRNVRPGDIVWWVALTLLLGGSANLHMHRELRRLYPKAV